MHKRYKIFCRSRKERKNASKPNQNQNSSEIFGVDVPYLIEKVRIGKYPIGIYEKHGKRAHIVIQTNLVAQYLGRTMEEIDAAVAEIEGGTSQ